MGNFHVGPLRQGEQYCYSFVCKECGLEREFTQSEEPNYQPPYGDNRVPCTRCAGYMRVYARIVPLI